MKSHCPHPWLAWLLLACLSFGFHSSLLHPAEFPEGSAAETLITQDSRDAPSVNARKVTTAPKLDGDVLQDTIWLEAEPIEDFWQTTPVEGAPASEKTSVRIIYTEDTLYIGVVCYDREPDSIIISDSRRDASLKETDSFQIILDTYLDRQNGFVFGTNPAGIQYDGQVSREGQGSGRLSGSSGLNTLSQTGSGGGFNLNWDAPWEVQALVSEIGWSAEFAIPFKTLRFRDLENQSWGLNMQRNIRRRNETAFWAPLTRQYDLYRLSEAGTLRDLQIQKPGNLKLIPYVLGRTQHQSDKTNWLGEFGTDLKYSVTPSLTLDFTYNTDFAQVEVDEEQINLDRFNLFFPEKRPFFLENAGLFSVGSPREVELFFSRRIGIGPDGEIVPILFGTRLTGKLARTNIGLLAMQTEELGGITPSNNFVVGRISRELHNRSALGAIFVNRQASGDLASEDDYNRTFALDGRWGIGEYGQVAGYLAGTSTPGREGDDYAYQIEANRNSPGLSLGVNYMEVAEDFNPEVGFLRRSRGFRLLFLRVLSRYRPKDFLGLLELRPHMTFRGVWNLEGFQETGQVHLDNDMTWKAGHTLSTALNLNREGVVEAFEIFPDVIVPEGTYDHSEVRVETFSNQGTWISVGLGARIGGFFGGDRTAVAPSLRLRSGETFSTELSLETNHIDLPGGSFNTNLGRARVSYSFTPQIAFQALVQYNDRADLWAMNFRFSWLRSANNGLFIVYNDTRTLGDLTSAEPSRSLTLKYSRVFDLID